MEEALVVSKVTNNVFLFWKIAENCHHPDLLGRQNLLHLGTYLGAKPICLGLGMQGGFEAHTDVRR